MIDEMRIGLDFESKEKSWVLAFSFGFQFWLIKVVIDGLSRPF